MVNNMEFNKKEFDTFRTDVKDALKLVAKKYGVDIDCGKINYTDFDFTMQLHVTKNDENTDGKRLMFEQDCNFYGFSKDDYEREFTTHGKQFKLIGFNRKSPKNCCTIYCITNGKTYKCSAEMVKNAFNDM